MDQSHHLFSDSGIGLVFSGEMVSVASSYELFDSEEKLSHQKVQHTLQLAILATSEYLLRVYWVYVLSVPQNSEYVALHIP
jgi:hypothetical protein